MKIVGREPLWQGVLRVCQACEKRNKYPSTKLMARELRASARECGKLRDEFEAAGTIRVSHLKPACDKDEPWRDRKSTTKQIEAERLARIAEKKESEAKESDRLLRLRTSLRRVQCAVPTTHELVCEHLARERRLFQRKAM
jgi:hypothetical protein